MALRHEALADCVGGWRRSDHACPPCPAVGEILRFAQDDDDPAICATFATQFRALERQEDLKPGVLCYEVVFAGDALAVEALGRTRAFLLGAG